MNQQILLLDIGTVLKLTKIIKNYAISRHIMFIFAVGMVTVTFASEVVFALRGLVYWCILCSLSEGSGVPPLAARQTNRGEPISR